MDVAAFSLAVPPVAVLVVQILEKVTEVVRKYLDAEQAVMDKKVIFQDHIFKLQLEVEEFTNVSPNLPEDLSKHFRVMFQTLLAKLKNLLYSSKIIRPWVPVLSSVPLIV